MVECICKAYSVQYRLPINIVRLTQTFGPGVEYNDGRVFAEFARCLVEHRDIILHTKGETKRNYLYTADAVRAILIVLLRVKVERHIMQPMTRPIAQFMKWQSWWQI